MNRTLQVLPAYFMLIAANALPVYGSALGKLLFFQVIYLCWMESLLRIFFDWIRIATARGADTKGDPLVRLDDAGITHGAQESWNSGSRIRLILQTTIARVLLLGFYMIFIIGFTALEVTGKEHRGEIIQTMLFNNSFFNSALIVFAINAAVELIGSFFLTGRFRTDSPRMHTVVYDSRMVLMHVMILISVFIHILLFKGRPYAAKGEIVYVGLFMLIKTIVEIRHLRRHTVEEPVPLL